MRERWRGGGGSRSLRGFGRSKCKRVKATPDGTNQSCCLCVKSRGDRNIYCSSICWVGLSVGVTSACRWPFVNEENDGK